MWHLLVQFFLHHLPHGVFLAATAGFSLPDIGGASGPIVDTTVTSDTADTADTGTDSTDDPDFPESSEDPEVDPNAKETKPSTETKIDWRTVPAEVKSHIQEIAKTNPKLGNLLQNAVYTSQSFLREVPGGIKEIRALKTEIEELGGMEEVKTLSQTHKQLVEEQESLDNQAREGNPQVLDNLVEIAGKEGFQKLMPVAVSRWASTDPAGYSHEMGKIMVNAMREGGLVSDLNMAFKMLAIESPEAKKEALECLKRAATWANGIHSISTTPPERPKVDPQLQQQQQEIDNQKTELFNNRFNQEFGTWRNGEILREVKALSGSRNLNEYQINTLGNKIVNDIKVILTSDPDYMKNLNRIYNSRDMAELHKFTRARTLKYLPEVSKKAYRNLFSNPTSVKKTASVKPPVNTNTQQAQPVAGWQKVSPDKAPAPHLIDDKKTSFEMKFQKQAILKDGTKVYWGNRVPA